MSAVRGADTKPELLIRKALHRAGFRFRLHARGLAGRPDMVFPKHNAVLFVHGCFWHHHDCDLFKLPATRTDFWLTKLTGNALRDERTRQALLTEGWRVGVVWECSMRGPKRSSVDQVAARIAKWLRGRGGDLVISGGGRT
jgi:DNA mismatch endonuclease (patch repair protein)